MADLYKSIAGSPITYLAADISANQTTISIADDSALPDGPNICTIGYGEHLETIKYETKSNGVLQNVTRGIEGIPRAWPAGTEVARFFTAYDHNAIIENFNSHLAESVTDDVHGILERYKGFRILEEGSGSGLVIDITLPTRVRPYLYITGYGMSSMYLFRVTNQPRIVITPIVEDHGIIITTNELHLQIEHLYTAGYSLIML